MRSLIGLVLLTLGLCSSFVEAADSKETPEIVFRRYIRLMREDKPDEAKLLIAKAEKAHPETIKLHIENDLQTFQRRSFLVRQGKSQGDCALVLICEDSDVDPGYCLRIDGRWHVVLADLDDPDFGLTERQKADFETLKAWFNANERELKKKYTLPRKGR